MDRFNVTDEEAFVRQPIKNGDINLDNVTSITGVYNLDIMVSDVLNCRIFLFSDLHVTSRNGFVNQDNGSLYLPLYLDALFKKHSDKQFDVMIEAPPFKNTKIEYSSNSVIASFVKQFDTCYQGILNKSECNKEWPHVRFHNVDIRKNEPHEILPEGKDNRFRSFVYKLQSRYDYTTYLLNHINENTDQEYLNKTFENETSKYKMIDLYGIFKKKNKYIFELVSKDDKFKKYKNVPNIKKINSYITNYLKMINLTTNIFDNIITLRKQKNILYYELLCLLDKIGRVYITVLSILMDYYTFIRFMKILSHGGKNIILLAGAIHLDNFKNFIKTIDSTSYLIKGYCNTNDETYELAKSIINNYKNYNLSIRIRVDILKDICNKMFNDIAESGDYYNPLLRNVYNLKKILESMYMGMNENHIFCTEYPENRVFKIESSVIENSLL